MPPALGVKWAGHWTGWRDNAGYQCLHQECVSNIRATITITTLTASQQYNLTNMARWGLRPWPRVPGDDGDISGQARLCVSVCSEIGDKCLAGRDIRARVSDVTRPRSRDQGAGQLGSPADCLGWSELMCHDDTRLADNYTPRCFTQMNSICWSITQPQHAINFQSWRLVYSGHSIDTRADTLSIYFLVSWIIAAFADTNDEV